MGRRKRRKGKRWKHDGAYHKLFDHPELVKSLLEEFVPRALWEGCDLTRLHRVNAKLHAIGLQKRDGDVIYRLPRSQGRALYLYVMIEFQSSSYRWMAVRMLVYVGLLYQHIISQEKLGADDLLPPVLPIVLYNGQDTYTAPMELNALLQVKAGDEEALARFQPVMRYLLLDEHAIEPGSARGRIGLSGLLFRLEQARTVEGFFEAIEVLIDQLAGDEHDELREAFFAWLTLVRLPNQGISLPLDRVNGLTEVHDMLREDIERRLQQSYDKGLERGIERGLERGGVEAARGYVVKVLSRKFGQQEMWALRLAGVHEQEHLDQLHDLALDADDAEQVVQALDQLTSPPHH